MGRAATPEESADLAFPSAALPSELSLAVSGACADVSHNLAGQRLGRKGRVTRERILSAALDLIENNEEEPFTLGGVARRAGLGMSSLYNYFSDQTELLLAVLDPVMATAEAGYMAQLREHWPDAELSERSRAFVAAYNDFWTRHNGLLHLRNTLADQLDVRMMRHRINSAQPLIALLGRQMCGGREPGRAEVSMATVLMTGIERSITLSTDRRIARLTGLPTDTGYGRYMAASSRLLEMAVRDLRANRIASLSA